jgi:circadian clock protein KaiC
VSLKLASSAALETPSDRISAGNPQADYILNGGFPVNSINIVMGQPGTGKTIFTEQLLFHNANDDRPVLYLTTLSEPFQKVVSYLQRFSFYDESKFGSTVIYDEVGYDLVEHGVDALRDKIHSSLRELQPKIVVIDSFKAVHDLVETPAHSRRWLVELAGILGASDTTTFLVGEYTTDQIAAYPEFAVADGIIEFARKPLSNRDERFMRVLKLRGSRYHEGLHGLRITGSGVEIFPRLITTGTERPELTLERISTSLPVLDQMLGGGLLRGSSTLLVGAAGTGKTTLGLQFVIDGVKRGEPGIFLNFQESPGQVERLIRSLGHDPHDLYELGLHMKYFSPVELHIDSIISELFSIVERGSTRRLIVDALGDLLSAASDTERLHDYLYSLMQYMSGAGMTSVMTLETRESERTDSITSGLRLSYMSDNIISLRLNAEATPPSRAVRVLKERASNHDLASHPFVINASGLSVQ